MSRERISRRSTAMRRANPSGSPAWPWSSPRSSLMSIFALGGDVAPFARTATSTIPIVMAVSVDPVLAGLVPSLARPGGNVTGVTFASSDSRGQAAAVPAASVRRRSHGWRSSGIPITSIPSTRATQAAARTLGRCRFNLSKSGLPAIFDEAFQAALKRDAQRRSSSVSSTADDVRIVPRIIELATQHDGSLLVAGWGPWAQAGALLSYGPDLNASVRRAAAYVDRILRGASPGTLAVEQPTTFELGPQSADGHLPGAEYPVGVASPGVAGHRVRRGDRAGTQS